MGRNPETGGPDEHVDEHREAAEEHIKTLRNAASAFEKIADVNEEVLGEDLTLAEAEEEVESRVSERLTKREREAIEEVR